MTEKSYYWSNRAIGDGAYSSYSDDEFSDIWRILFQRDRTSQSVIEDYLNELEVTNPAGNTIRVATGAALVDGKFYITDSVVDNTILTPSVATRNDRVVLRKSWAAQTVRIAIITGVEGGAVPAITQTDGVTWEVPLASIRITTGGTITITDERATSRTALAFASTYELGMTFIEKYTVGAGGVASVTFSSLGAFTHLLLMGTLRSAVAAVTDTLYLRFNADAGANYSSQYIRGNNATVTGAAAALQNQIALGLIPGASGIANYFGAFSNHILNYNNASVYKNVLCEILGIPNATAANFYLQQSGGIWNNVAAITSLTLLAAGGNIIEYSEFSLYGLT